MNKANINKYIEERIKKVSSEFEVDLIRLLKTNSYVSNLGNLTKENSNFIKSKLTEIKDILRQFSIKLYETERNLIINVNDSPEQKNIGLFDDLLSEITNYQNSINNILSKIEDDERDITNKIDALFKHYSLELEVTQKELDYRLNFLQKEFIEYTPSSAVNKVLVEKKQEQVVEDTGVNEDITVNRKVFNQAIIYVLALVVLGALILIGIINLNDKESIISERSDIKGDKINSEINDNYINSVNTHKPEEKKLNKKNIVENDEGKSSQLTTVKFNKDTEGKTKINNILRNDIEKVSTSFKNIEQTKPIQKRDFLMVKGVGANVREGPGINYPVVFIVESGQKFIDLNVKRGIWMKIKMNDGRIGWISSKLINAKVY